MNLSLLYCHTLRHKTQSRKSLSNLFFKDTYTVSFPFILGIQAQTTAAAETGTGKAAQKAGKFPCKFFCKRA